VCWWRGLFVFDLCCVVFVYLRRLVAEAPPPSL
jgi:hypothetical protein